MGVELLKDDISTLPAEVFEGEIVLINTLEEATEAMRYLSSFSVLGFDTETRPAFRKGQVNQISLIQISTVDRCFLFRLNKLPKEFSPASIISNTNIIKVGLSLRDDFAALRKRYTEDPENCIDLQPYVKSYGIEYNSLQKIYAQLFKKRISKKQRLSNWDASELTGSQQMYAAIDAWACLKIFNFLNDSNTILKNE